MPAVKSFIFFHFDPWESFHESFLDVTFFFQVIACCSFRAVDCVIQLILLQVIKSHHARFHELLAADPSELPVSLGLNQYVSTLCLIR